MCNKRHVEIFSAGCDFCHDLIEKVKDLACESCQIDVLNLNEKEIVEKARSYGIHFAPAVAVDGKPLECCQDSGPDMKTMRDAGIGQEE